uniref:Wsv083 n=1 Tax=White spot syndrome virus TaxID=92652 RepID=A0A2U9GAW9_WSSV|nr:wsv083 [Shrimp white spot syndrome virus]AWQ61537.1 wsv083 [Shrimp white spot syndrome virus]
MGGPTVITTTINTGGDHHHQQYVYHQGNKKRPVEEYNNNNYASGSTSEATTVPAYNNNNNNITIKTWDDVINLSITPPPPKRFKKSEVAPSPPTTRTFSNVCASKVIRQCKRQYNEWIERDSPYYFKGIEKSCSLEDNYDTCQQLRIGHRSIVKSSKYVHDTCFYGKDPKVGFYWPTSSCDEEMRFFDTRHILKELSSRNIPSSQIMDIMYMAVEVFQLPSRACERIRQKTSTLIKEVSDQCENWENFRKTARGCLSDLVEVPEDVKDFNTFICPWETFFEIKYGVYYIVNRGTVVKFMKDMNYEEFVFECVNGLSVYRKNIKGVVGVTGVCPQGLCLEMPFAGISIDDVIRCVKDSLDGGEYYESRDARLLYGVVMLQRMGRLPEVKGVDTVAPITDSFIARKVVRSMFEKLKVNMPFVLAETCNVITRVANEGIINVDIKADNFVIDSISGQPKMIDLGLSYPLGYCYNDEYFRNTEELIRQYIHTPPEFFRGHCLGAYSMTYSFSVMASSILEDVVACSNMEGPAFNLMSNMHFLMLLQSGTDTDFYQNRPSITEYALAMKHIFPFKGTVMNLFKVKK